MVGFEIEIARLDGKWKLGQNRTAADRQSAAAHLRTTGDPLSAQIADLMERTIRPSRA